jgi:hypothetical protein
MAAITHHAALIVLVLIASLVVQVGGASSEPTAAAALKPRPFGPRVGAWVGRRNLALGRKCTPSSLAPGTSERTLTDGQRFGVFEAGRDGEGEGEGRREGRALFSFLHFAIRSWLFTGCSTHWPTFHPSAQTLEAASFTHPTAQRSPPSASLRCCSSRALCVKARSVSKERRVD